LSRLVAVSEACCAPPGRGDPIVGGDSTAAVARLYATPAAGVAKRMVSLPGGEFEMGNDAGDGYPADGESPAHRVRLRRFRIDPQAISNADFASFIEVTGHVTDAERYGWSFVFAEEHLMNVFQGRFPIENTCADGYAGTAPVDAYLPNGFGLFNVTGNVWELCVDWFDPGYYRVSPVDDPSGPDHGVHRVMRGGSYLCHASYCGRFRVDARSGTAPDSSAGNVGFRVAHDA
jgi:formylglycine-generating enzyme required for sulfatase activity